MFYILEEHPRSFGKENRVSAQAETVLHPAVLCPSSINPQDSFPHRIKGGLLSFVPWFLHLQHHKPPLRHRESRRPSRQPHAGLGLVPQEKLGRCAGWGPRVRPLSHLSQEPKERQGLLHCTCSPTKKAILILFFLRETGLSWKFGQGFAFADHQQLAAYTSAQLGLLRHFNSAVI